MLKFNFGWIIEYAYSEDERAYEALKEFFGDDLPGREDLMDEQVNALFNEWLIFDFKLPNKMTIAAEYFLQNPDRLEELLLDQLEEILKTQFYDLLEITEAEKGKWIKLYSFAKKKTFKIWDKTASSYPFQKASLLARIGKAGNRWYFVGSDPLRLPFYSTDRLKKLMGRSLDGGGSFFTVKGAVEMLRRKKSPGQSSGPRIYTKKEIKNKRKKLEKKFNQLTQKHDFQFDFRKVIKFIYEENYQSNHADMLLDLVKLGIPEKVVFNSVRLFQDVWNFFPHRKLKGKCPAEMYQEAYLK